MFERLNITYAIALLALLSTILGPYLYHLAGVDLRLDEIFILLLVLLYLTDLAFKLAIHRQLYTFDIQLAAVFLILLLSAVANLKAGLATQLVGIYYILKNVIAYGVLYRSQLPQEATRSLVRATWVLAIASSLVGVIQFSIPSIGALTFDLIPSPEQGPGDNLTRCFGLVMGSPNRQGLFLVIGYLCGRVLYKSLQPGHALLIAGILVTASKTAIFCLLLVLVAELMFHRRKAAFIAVLLVLAPIFVYFSASAVQRVAQTAEKVERDAGYFRFVAFENSLQVLGDHPFLGVGPGRYGGSVAALFDSPVHKTYDTFEFARRRNLKVNTIDMFWPHLWGEVGIVGLLGYTALILMIIWRQISDYRLHKDTKFVYAALMMMVLMIGGASTQSMEASMPGLIVFLLLGAIQGTSWDPGSSSDGNSSRKPSANAHRARSRSRAE